MHENHSQGGNVVDQRLVSDMLQPHDGEEQRVDTLLFHNQSNVRNFDEYKGPTERNISLENKEKIFLIEKKRERTLKNDSANVSLPQSDFSIPKNVNDLFRNLKAIALKASKGKSTFTIKENFRTLANGVKDLGALQDFIAVFLWNATSPITDTAFVTAMFPNNPKRLNSDLQRYATQPEVENKLICKIVQKDVLKSISCMQSHKGMITQDEFNHRLVQESYGTEKIIEQKMTQMLTQTPIEK